MAWEPANAPARARRWYLRSAALAEKVEAPYQLGLTLLEKGAQLDSRDDLERAATVLGDIGARSDHERAIRLLENRRPQ